MNGSFCKEMWKLHFFVSFILFALILAEDSTTLPNSTEINYNSTIQPTIYNEVNNEQKPVENKTSVPRKGVEFPTEETQLLNMSSTNIPSDEKKEPSKPRKGAVLSDVDVGDEQKKEFSKPRKGALLLNESENGQNNISVTPIPIVKFKPTASGLDPLGDDENGDPSTDLTALTVGLSLGVVLVLILASVSYWRLRDVWSRRQYKRVDFLIDGMYVDT